MIKTITIFATIEFILLTLFFVFMINYSIFVSLGISFLCTILSIPVIMFYNVLLNR